MSRAAIRRAAQRMTDNYPPFVPPIKKKREFRRVDTAPALIVESTTLANRITRLAPFATGEQRLRIMGELELLRRVVDTVEERVAIEARCIVAELARAIPSSARREGRRGLRKGATP